MRLLAALCRTSACRCRPVGEVGAEMALASPHQMTAGIVGDDGVRHPVLAEFPGGQAGALVARPCLIDPDMHRDAGFMGAVNRRQRGTPIPPRTPPPLAMAHPLDAPLPTP